MKLQIEIARQLCHEFLISVGFRPAQLVIEMNNRKDNPQLAAQFQQNAQQRHGINPARNGYADPIPGVQQLLPPNVGKHALRE